MTIVLASLPSGANTIPPGLSYAQLISTYTLANGNIPGNPFYQTSDTGLWWFNGAIWTQQSSYVLGQGGVPFVRQSSWTAGNNGAITLTTALTTAYPNCWMQFPPNTLYSGSPPGIYFVQMSSTTVGTVYYNFYSGQQPNIPTTLIPIVATGAGAQTAVTNYKIIAAEINVPGNIMGLNGEISIEYVWQAYNSSTNKSLSCQFGGQNLSNSSNVTTSQWNSSKHSVRNAGVTGRQVCINSQPIGDYAGTGTAISYPTVDTTVGQLVEIGFNLSTAATDWAVLESFSVKFTPSTLLDNPPVPAVIAASASIVPPGAAALGCNVNKFFQLTTAASIDFTETNNGPLFARLYYQTKPTTTLGFNAASGYASTVNGSLCLQGGVGGAGGYAGGLVCTANPTNGTSSLPLLTSANKWYAEFALTLSSNDNNLFDAVWMLPNEHGFPGVTTYVEVDVFEAGGADDNYNTTNSMRSTTINWVAGSPTSYLSTGGVTFNHSQEQIFGVGYDPTAAKLYYYMNGVLQYTRDVSSFNTNMNTNHYFLLFNWGTHASNVTITFTSAPTGTSGTLNAAWTLPTGAYSVGFSTGELRMVNFTQGNTSVNWTNTLATSPTTTATAAGHSHAVYLRYLSGWSTV